MVLVLAMVGLLVNGVRAGWSLGRLRTGTNSVHRCFQNTTQALQVADKGLTRANGERGKLDGKPLAQLNTLATQLGDRAQTNSPLITTLSQRVDTKLAPVLDKHKRPLLPFTTRR